jgi:hypothetical protein
VYVMVYTGMVLWLVDKGHSRLAWVISPLNMKVFVTNGFIFSDNPCPMVSLVTLFKISSKGTSFHTCTCSFCVPNMFQRYQNATQSNLIMEPRTAQHHHLSIRS